MRRITSPYMTENVRILKAKVKIGTRRSACGFSYHDEQLLPVFE